MRAKQLSFEQYKQGKRGFTLVEMAIVLVIIGLLMATVLGFAVSTRKSSQVTVTNTREEIIKTSLMTFLARNNRLPCPAVAALAPGAAGYGVEDTPGAALATACPLTVKSTDAFGVTVVTGVVPWISLGLSDDVGTDGYYNRFTYQVAQTATFTTLTAQTIGAIKGAISIHSTATPTAILGPTSSGGNQINDCTPAGGNYNPCSAVAIIVSHGSNGYYAYTRQGNQLAGIGGTDEAENGIVGGVTNSKFVMKDFVDSTANPYDDIVLPLTANDLLTPLTNNGSVQSSQAILQNDFNNLTASITAAAVAGRDAGFGVVPPCTLVWAALNIGSRAYHLAAPPAVNDPWGNPILVTNINANPICSATPSTTLAFTLTSYGPDGVAGGGDDIISNIQVSGLQTAFGAAGW